MKRKGFTLIELMIVIAIIALLAAVALPKFSSASEAAKVANVQGNLANLRTALAIHYAKNKSYPPRNDTGIPANGDSVGVEFQKYYSRTSIPDTPQGEKVAAARNNVDALTVTTRNGGWRYEPNTGEIRANLESAKGGTGGAYGENTINWDQE